MITAMMLAAAIGVFAQPASHPSKPSAPHTQPAPAHQAPSPPPPQHVPPSGNATPAPATGVGAGRGEVDHSAAARRNWDHRRAYYWQYYKRSYRRGGYNNGVSSGVRVVQGTPSPPISIQAVHNLDGTVTVTWVMPGGVIQDGDVFEVGRRQPGQTDFWKIGETTQPRFVDRQLQTLTSGTQYAVAVRRVVGADTVWSPMSAVSSTRPNHPLSPQRGQQVKPTPGAPVRADPKPPTNAAPVPTPAPSAPR